jgi:hypothetical protein
VSQDPLLNYYADEGAGVFGSSAAPLTGVDCLDLLLGLDDVPFDQGQLDSFMDFAARGKEEDLELVKDAVDLLHDSLIDEYCVFVD